MKKHRSRLIGAVALTAAVACGASSHDAIARDSGTAASAASPSPSIDHPGTVASTSAGAVADDRAPTRPANHLGRIPIVEYHVIGGTKNALYTRTVESFRSDLDELYRRGYRPITISQLLDRDFSDVPAGMSPVAVVFDDASPEQFSYLDSAGKLTIDPTSAVGIWQAFAASHPGWGDRATFCMLNGAAAGHNFFGDKPKYAGQRPEWRFRKVQWLAANGFELCGHTVWHARLDKFPDAVVQEQIARNVMAIDSAVPGYKVRTFALPYGIWPKNRALAWQGSWTDPKTGQVHSYRFDAVLEVAGGPARSPFDPQFDPHRITRIQAIGGDVHRALEELDRGSGEAARFVR